MATKRLRQKRSQQFYEALPGAYMDSYNLFPPAQNYQEEAELHQEQEAAVPNKIRRRIVRQGLLLLGLLAVQVILFIVLLRSTLNLG